MPSISTCIISQLTALQRDCLICVNSIPQPCRTLQRSKCQDEGMRKIKERSYGGSNGGEQQMEFTDTHTQNTDVTIFSAALTQTHKTWLTFFLLFDWLGWERCWSFGVCVLTSVIRQLQPASVCKCIHLFFCALKAYIPLCHFHVFPRMCVWWLHGYGCVLHSMTYLSALTYSSSTGTQGTFPSLTPIWMSLNCRPRFSPRMVTLVPPWRGPVSGNNWTNKRMEEETEEQEKRIQKMDKRTGGCKKEDEGKRRKRICVFYFIDHCYTTYTPRTHMYAQFNMLSQFNYFEVWKLT